jgi:hypothetical protein
MRRGGQVWHSGLVRGTRKRYTEFWWWNRRIDTWELAGCVTITIEKAKFVDCVVQAEGRDELGAFLNAVLNIRV